MKERDKQINIKISSDQKSKWENYLEKSPEYSSLSDLIRASVEYEIAGDNDGSGSEILNEQLVEQLDTIAQDQSRIKNRMSTLEAATIDEETVSEIIEEQTSHTISMVLRRLEQNPDVKFENDFIEEMVNLGTSKGGALYNDDE